MKRPSQNGRVQKLANIVLMVNMLARKVSEQDAVINHKTDGTEMRLTLVQAQADDNTVKLGGVNKNLKEIVKVARDADKLAKESIEFSESVDVALHKAVKDINDKIDNIKEETETLKAIAYRHSIKLEQLNENVVNLTARSMQNNITISGLIGDVKDENCKQTFYKFIGDVMNIPIELSEIMVAHRVGKSVAEQHRLMVARCIPNLKQRILQNVCNLKGVKNSLGQFYYVNKQFPEALMECDREIRQMIKDIKKKEEDIPTDSKIKIEVRAGVLYLNNEPVKKKVKHPTTLQLYPDKQEKRATANIKFVNSDPYEEKDSQFIALAAKVNGLNEVRRTYVRVRKLYPLADHVAVAYKTPHASGFQDNEEHTSGWTISKVITEAGVANVAVLLVRVYGGQKLGKKRFELMQNAAKQALHRMV